MITSETIQSIAGIVGPDNVLSDPYDLDRYSADALNPFRAFGAEEAFDQLADLVVRPSCTREVVDLVTLAGEHGIPIIPYGGGTGVMGGTIPVRGGIILDMNRMNRILSINPIDQPRGPFEGLIPCRGGVGAPGLSNQPFDNYGAGQ